MGLGRDEPEKSDLVFWLVLSTGAVGRGLSDLSVGRMRRLVLYIYISTNVSMATIDDEWYAVPSAGGLGSIAEIHHQSIDCNVGRTQSIIESIQ